MILGLTGGIGSGKSTVSKIFLSMKLKVLDADLIAKNILESDEVKKELQNKIGKEFFFSESTKIDRKKLKKKIFSDPDKLKILNEIIHPKVLAIYKKIYEEYIIKDEVIIFDVPLLFEINLDKYCNKVIVIDIDPEIQIKRIKERDGIEENLIMKIISSQISRIERNSKADILIDNNGTYEELEFKTKQIIEDIKRGKI
ncbi:MAG: dephospho-CoA kinase [Cetobacterium sp.]|uniref:dephospho-CoA kinase n=1 Tax=Cetobacterium sp. TaxID=2071632 RepID=UPI003F32AA0F